MSKRNVSKKELERFCSNCGKVTEVVPVSYLGKIDKYYAYEARCCHGHCFSVTLTGLNIILLPYPPQILKHMHPQLADSI